MRVHSLRKRRWCIRRRLEGWTMDDIGRHTKVSRRSVYRWLRVYQEGGWKALQPKSSSPQRIKRIITQDVLERIADLRETYGYEKDKDISLMRQEGIPISASSVYNGLERLGLLNKEHRPYRMRSYIRWERRRPNELWQMDVHTLGEGAPYLLRIASFINP